MRLIGCGMQSPTSCLHLMKGVGGTGDSHAAAGAILRTDNWSSKVEASWYPVWKRKVLGRRCGCRRVILIDYVAGLRRHGIVSHSLIETGAVAELANQDTALSLF